MSNDTKILEAVRAEIPKCKTMVVNDENNYTRFCKGIYMPYEATIPNLIRFYKEVQANKGNFKEYTFVNVAPFNVTTKATYGMVSPRTDDLERREMSIVLITEWINDLSDLQLPIRNAVYDPRTSCVISTFGLPSSFYNE